MKQKNKTIIIVIIIIILFLLGSCCINYLVRIKTTKKPNLKEIKTEVLSNEKIFELNQVCLDKKDKIQEELNVKKYISPKDFETKLKSKTIKEIFYSPTKNSCMYTVYQVITTKDIYGYDESIGEFLIYKYGTDDVFKRLPLNIDAYIYNETTYSEQELELNKLLQTLKNNL